MHYPENFPLLNKIGTIYLRVSNFPQAEKVFSSLVRRIPDEEAFQVNLALAQLYQLKIDEAEYAAKKALKLKTDDARVFVILAGVASQRDEPDDAILQLRKIKNTDNTRTFIKEPVFDKIRNTEKFQEYLEELGVSSKEGVNEQNPNP